METKRLNKLFDIRKENGYSMVEMAKKLKICVSYYCQLELGHRNLYYKMAIKIANIFNLKPDDLFYEDLR